MLKKTEQKKKQKQRNEIIEADLDAILKWAKNIDRGMRTVPSLYEIEDFDELVIKAYHLGMDTGIKIGKEEI